MYPLPPSSLTNVYFAFCASAAQRFALPALGRGRRSRPTGKKLRRENCLGCAQNPQRQVHALLGAFLF